MPHFVGMTESDAQRRLETAGLRRKINYVSAPQWPRGTVIDQTPLAGARLPALSTIELTVAN
jgi:beta-lactam-binding protein with PASTA domain